MKTPNLDVYHLAFWRPITPAEYAQALVDATGTMDEPETLKTEVVDLGDTRVAVVTHAHMKLAPTHEDGPYGEIGPYLMVLANVLGESMGGKAHCFIRQEELAVD